MIKKYISLTENDIIRGDDEWISAASREYARFDSYDCWKVLIGKSFVDHYGKEHLQYSLNTWKPRRPIKKRKLG